MALNLVLLAVGFLLLIKGADFLVSGASALAKAYHIPELVIGLTIVAFGTSAPEMVVNVVSAIQDHPDIVLGNIIGSNNFNLFIILGIAALVYPLSVQLGTIKREVPLSFLAVLLVLFLANDKFFWGSEVNMLDRFDAAILMLLFAFFLFSLVRSSKKETLEDGESNTRPWGKPKTFLFISAGLAGLIIGGKLVVDNAIGIARELEISEKLIGLTIVAAGTSLPELATSLVAAIKKKSDIAVGNVVGSNIFNLALILAASAFIRPLSYHETYNTDLLLLALGTFLLFLAMFTGKARKIDRWEGLVLLLVFLVYSAYLIIQETSAI